MERQCSITRPVSDNQRPSNQELAGPVNKESCLDQVSVSVPQMGCVILELALPDLDPNQHGDAAFEELAQEKEELVKLRHRDMGKSVKTLADFDSEFGSFKLRAEKHKIKFLVRPSGRLNYPLAHYLNQPFFSTLTERWEDGPTADMFSPCTRMIMENVFERDHTIIFDHLHNRSAKSEDINHQNSDLYKRHVSFTLDILESIESKVVIVYGAKLQRVLIQSRQLKFLLLCGRYEGTLIALDREESYTYRLDQYRYRRIFCFSLHAQRLMYESQGSDVLVRHDRITEAAANMAGLSHLVRPNFYRDRLWTKGGPDIDIWQQTRNLASQLYIPPLRTADAAKRNHALEVSSLSLWNELWDNQPPHGNQLLAAEVLPAALAVWDDQDEQPKIWKDLSDIPLAVTRWLQGSRYAVFGSAPVPAQDVDIVKVLCDLAYPESSKALPLDQILLRLIRNQNRLVKLVAKKRFAGLVHCGVGQTLPVRCYTCGNGSQDENPQWAVNWPGHYYVRQLTCRASDCRSSKHSWKFFRPKAWDVLRTPPNANLHQSGFDTKFTLQSVLRTREECAQLPDQVESWCIRCKGETRIQGNKQTIIDRDPSWTLGKMPLYLEKRPDCLSCKDAGQPTGRFVPVDVCTPSVIRTSMISVAQYLVDLDREVRGIVMDSVLKPSAREYRQYKGSGMEGGKE